jgi:integrase
VKAEVTTMANSRDSRPKRKSAKPKKPRADFPLFPHAAGYWAKKVRQKLVYFGKIADDPKGVKALALWLEQKDELLAGRTPRAKRDGLTVADLCNRFLTAKIHLLYTRELSARTYHDYKRTTDRLVSVFGGSRLVDDLASDDFGNLRADISKKRGPMALGNEVGRVRVVFKFGYDAGLIEKPIRFGPGFSKPSKKTLRKERQKKPPKMFSPGELKSLIIHADTQMRTMILLAVNGGFGNADLGTLPLSAIDLEAGWIVFPRQKTAIERRTPLWKATTTALKKWLAIRPEHESDLVFITKYGSPWFKSGDADSAKSANPLSAEFRKLCQALGVYQTGRGFYAIRHTFQTIGEEAGETATRYLMGHVDDSMSATYREHIADSRLLAVTDHVRLWLFGKAVAK